MMEAMVGQQKILIIHLVSNGDCLYVTAIARQIKKDFPGCHLTWMISNLCSQVLLNNDDVDQIEILEVKNIKDAMFSAWYALHEQKRFSAISSQYDHIFETQFFPANVHHYDGTIRSTLLRSYPNFKNMQVTPHVRLTGTEIANANNFGDNYNLRNYRQVVLFECTPGSGQSFINQGLALEISKKLVGFFPEMFIVLSTHLHLETNHDRIAVGNTISFRENAQLALHCNLLIGASSGITWLLTSDWITKPIPSIQLLNVAKGISFASVKYDFDYWGLDHSHIVEIFTPDAGRVIDCVKLYYDEGMPACIKKYNEDVKPNPFFIKDYFNMVAKRKHISLLMALFSNFAERNGMSFKLVIACIYIWLQGLLRIPFVLLRKKNEG
jgi:hypothetical protein